MKAVDLSEENLEDLLAYDDLFLDYFNAFLALPAFPQAFYYDRLTGTFREVEGSYSSVNSSVVLPDHAPYGATDEEREHMLEWAKQERLPLFLRTKLFREFKLCKLLLRSLDDRYSAGRVSSNALRGYSRQTGTSVSSLSNSADNSANEASDYEDNISWTEVRKSALYRYERPGSRALSLPPKLGLGEMSASSTGDQWYLDDMTDNRRRLEDNSKTPKSASGKKSRGPSQSQTPGLGFQGVTDSGMGTSLELEKTLTTRTETLASINENEQAYPSNEKKSKERSLSKQTRDSTTLSKFSKREKNKRAISAPVNYNEFMRIPTYSDFDAIFGEEEPDDVDGEVYVAFNEEVVSEQQTETDVRKLEGKHNMTLQQMKEMVLSTLVGFEDLKAFLQDTSGIHLLNFWLDCEFFKDSMEDYDDMTNMAVRNRLFRDIQDKYKINLTEDAQIQLRKTASSSSLSHTIFIRTQYNVLRRLRAYWVPRYLIHKERMDELSSKLKKYKFMASDLNLAAANKELSSSFLPSISVVNSLPVKPDEILHIAQTRQWDFVIKSGRQWDDRVRSARVRFIPKAPHRTMRDKLLIALSADKAAGGPFQRYLEKQQNPELLANHLFWQDVSEYSAEEDRSADRLLRMTHAWGIYNKYIGGNVIYSINMDPKERDVLHQQLMGAKDFIEASVFNSAQDHAVDVLEQAWVRYLKEDLKTFLEVQARSQESDFDSIHTAEEIEVSLENEQLVVKRFQRPWVRRSPGSTGSERGRRLRTALSVAEEIDEARKAEKKKKALERRKKMEKERRKALRAARARQREAKRNKNAPIIEHIPEEKKEGEEEEDQGERLSPGGHSLYGDMGGGGLTPPPVLEDKPVELKDMVGNKQIINMFKKHIQESEPKEKLNMLNLYLDIDSFLAIEGGSKKKKDVQASYIFKNYLEQGHARKFVKISDSAYAKVSKEKERPKTPTIKEIRDSLYPNIDATFKEFWQKNESTGTDLKNLNSMSKAELAMRSDSDLQFTWKSKKGKQKSTGRHQPTKDDKVEFLMNLNQSVLGQMPIRMWFFYKYLVKHGEDENVPHLEKDLFFYIEVQKFKEMSHAYSDEELLRRKVATLNLCYLESNIPPALQIGISNDVHQKTLRAVQRYLGNKEMVSAIFDEAQYHVFKELLPWWAGFIRQYTPPADEKKRPLTKQQKMFKKRLEMFEQMDVPKTQFVLPHIPQGSVQAFSFSLSDGVKWRKNVSYEEQMLIGLGPAIHVTSAEIDNTTPQQSDAATTKGNRLRTDSQQSRVTKVT
ncbi:uncharacterized protein LOC106156055 isoform X2 [Lingula anatina]|uniref:Uncharacterized protein LOC106156055 isoform X2 n=1 Tax=Lingula anatina TaxID=7574 RepID=A0A1S3HNJ4_LINAN|nr:uncharacterized protein LOC106156055 isoform X2 [Lingula anatina]|eukprot:XP_013386604.1 uncharacterized protein LOC106156055 isoform X2 [Lingula anatina]